MRKLKFKHVEAERGKKEAAAKAEAISSAERAESQTFWSKVESDKYLTDHL